MDWLGLLETVHVAWFDDDDSALGLYYSQHTWPSEGAALRVLRAYRRDGANCFADGHKGKVPR